MSKLNRKNIWILLKTLLFVVVVIGFKLLADYFDWEFITINALFSGVIAGNVFLMGFLLNGVLADYKESEKIPVEMSACLYSINDELSAISKIKSAEKTKEGQEKVLKLAKDIKRWFHRKERTNKLLKDLKELFGFYSEIEQYSQVTFINRLKQETAILKKLIIRTDVIRDSQFISSGYFIASAITSLLCFGLVFSVIEKQYESIFFVGVISFFMIYLLMLIKDLDNPFAYEQRFSAENVSLHPIEKFIKMEKEEIKSEEPIS